MLKRHFYLAALLLSTLAVTGFAQEEDLAELRERLEKLEKQQQPGKDNWTDRIGFAGLVEVDGSYTDSENFDGKSASDITLATAELGVIAKLSNTINVEISALYEEDRRDLEIDVARIEINDLLDGSTTMEIGQFYQPFGAFETYMVNDTLIYDVAETRETAVLGNWEQGRLNVSAYVFSGDVDSGGNTFKNFGASLGYQLESFSVGVDYISNVYNSYTLSDAVGNQVNHGDGALILRAKTNFRGIHVISEYFHSEELSALNNIKPKILQLEAAIKSEQWTYAVAVQASDDAAAIGLPESRWSIAAGVRIEQNVKLNFEYWYDRDYGQSDGGTDNDSNSVVGQIAVFF